MSQQGWHLTAHTSAENELQSVPQPYRREIKRIAQEASEKRQPSEHRDISIMRDASGIMRIKVDGYRALCDLDKPAFRILLVDERETVYNKLKEAEKRQGD